MIRYIKIIIIINPIVHDGGIADEDTPAIYGNNTPSLFISLFLSVSSLQRVIFVMMNSESGKAVKPDAT
jgi:hypothetical protein